MIMPKVEIVKFRDGETLEVVSSHWFRVLQDIEAITYSIQEQNCVIHQWEGFPDGVEIPEQASEHQLLKLAGIC
jgi:hypothetical protein